MSGESSTALPKSTDLVELMGDISTHTSTHASGAVVTYQQLDDAFNLSDSSTIWDALATKTDMAGNNLLHLIAMHGKDSSLWPLVPLIHKKHPDLFTAQNEQSRTPADEAVLNANTWLLEKLLLTATSDDGVTPLFAHADILGSNQLGTMATMAGTGGNQIAHETVLRLFLFDHFDKYCRCDLTNQVADLAYTNERLKILVDLHIVLREILRSPKVTHVKDLNQALVLLKQRAEANPAEGETQDLFTSTLATFVEALPDNKLACLLPYRELHSIMGIPSNQKKAVAMMYMVMRSAKHADQKLPRYAAKMHPAQVVAHNEYSIETATDVMSNDDTKILINRLANAHDNDNASEFTQYPKPVQLLAAIFMADEPSSNAKLEILQSSSDRVIAAYAHYYAAIIAKNGGTLRTSDYVEHMLRSAAKNLAADVAIQALNTIAASDEATLQNLDLLRDLADALTGAEKYADAIQILEALQTVYKLHLTDKPQDKINLVEYSIAYNHTLSGLASARSGNMKVAARHYEKAATHTIFRYLHGAGEIEITDAIKQNMQQQVALTTRLNSLNQGDLINKHAATNLLLGQLYETQQGHDSAKPQYEIAANNKTDKSQPAAQVARLHLARLEKATQQAKSNKSKPTYQQHIIHLYEAIERSSVTDQTQRHELRQTPAAQEALAQLAKLSQDRTFSADDRMLACVYCVAVLEQLLSDTMNKRITDLPSEIVRITLYTDAGTHQQVAYLQLRIQMIVAELKEFRKAMRQHLKERAQQVKNPTSPFWALPIANRVSLLQHFNNIAPNGDTYTSYVATLQDSLGGNQVQPALSALQTAGIKQGTSLLLHLTAAIKLSPIAAMASTIALIDKILEANPKQPTRLAEIHGNALPTEALSVRTDTASDSNDGGSSSDLLDLSDDEGGGPEQAAVAPGKNAVVEFSSGSEDKGGDDAEVDYFNDAPLFGAD